MKLLWQMRSAKKEDATFISRVTKVTMSEVLSRTYKTKERKKYLTLNANIGTKIIKKTKILFFIRNNKTIRIGRLTVTRNIKNIIIEEIHILKKYQGMSIGSSIIKDLKKEAEINKKILEIIVLKKNRAFFLYQRLGFDFYQKGERFFMSTDIKKSLCRFEIIYENLKKLGIS